MRRNRATDICDSFNGANFFPSSSAATGGPTMALPKMDLPVGKERKGPAPDMDSIHRWDLWFLEIGFFDLSLQLVNCPEHCSTRSLPRERSKHSQSQCRKSLRTNRIGGRGGVKSTMMKDRISVDQMILKCYHHQLAVFIFGFAAIDREVDHGSEH